MSDGGGCAASYSLLLLRTVTMMLRMMRESQACWCYVEAGPPDSRRVRFRTSIVERRDGLRGYGSSSGLEYVGKQDRKYYCLGRGKRQRSTWDSQSDLKERVAREEKLSDVYVKFYVT
jgi:hypothetical protein